MIMGDIDFCLQNSVLEFWRQKPGFSGLKKLVGTEEMKNSKDLLFSRYSEYKGKENIGR